MVRPKSEIGPTRIIQIRLSTATVEKIDKIVEEGYAFSKTDFTRKAVVDAILEYERLHPTTD